MLPALRDDGFLPEGIPAAACKEIRERFGVGSEARERQGDLLRQIVAATHDYPTIKRILLWGSSVTAKSEPNDLDYSIVVAKTHAITRVAEAHRRFFVPSEARRFYGTDTGYVVIYDYPLEYYIDKVDFITHTRQ